LHVWIHRIIEKFSGGCDNSAAAMSEQNGEVQSAMVAYENLN